jgi:hypothetical protein
MTNNLETVSDLRSSGCVVQTPYKPGGGPKRLVGQTGIQVGWYITRQASPPR